MSEGSQSKQETQASDSQKGVYDRNLLLLVPELVYSTGNVFEHWQLDPRVPESEKEELANRKVVQSFLARFMKSRSDNVLRGLSPGDAQAIKIERAIRPIATLEYGGKKNGMKLYLGAQYAYFAARYLGEKPTRNIDELLDLIEREKENRKEFNKDLFPGNQAVPSEIENPELAPNHPLVQKVNTVDHVGSLGQGASQTKRKPLTEKVLSKFTKHMPQKVIQTKSKILNYSTMFIAGFLVSAAFASVLWHHEMDSQLKELEERWRNEGPSSLEKSDYISLQKNTSPDLVYKMLWKGAYDPKMDTEKIQPFFDHLVAFPEPIWQARANQGMAIAFLNRGEFENAFHHLTLAEEFLIDTKYASDLRRVYLSMAHCLFYSQDAESMLEMITKAENLDVNTSESRISFFKALYFFLVGDPGTATVHADKSLHISLAEGAKSQTAYYHATLALLCVSDNKLEDAYRHLRLAQEYAVETKDRALLFQLQGYEMLWAERMGLPPVALEEGSSKGLLKNSVIQRRSFIELAREHF
ncbi:hypothetical protein [Acanthopleuribacter pedis]|uniref:Uncharacterized protein n=1 Tax=Acanthopleuribacter pedis TaxID=442870 RepID=A0A8J7QSM3_9BACT|nr:hypothetical protein [Acanthopleuribacter pedis]MBO1323410.1 hypothetical protein [Acanthopleuribacter pedis]